MKKITIFRIVVIVIAFVLGFGALMITKKSDSPAEQAAEAVLKSQGIDIDFSPDDDEDHE